MSMNEPTERPSAEDYRNRAERAEQEAAELRKALSQISLGGGRELNGRTCADIASDALGGLNMAPDMTTRFLSAVEAELRRARTLFPGDRIMTIALAEEFGELAKAMLDEHGPAVWKEAVQTAVMAARVAIDGDSSVDEWRAAKGLGEHRCGGTAPQFCDHCGARRRPGNYNCAPPFAVRPHEWTGKHPADIRAAEEAAQ